MYEFLHLTGILMSDPNTNLTWRRKSFWSKMIILAKFSMDYQDCYKNCFCINSILNKSLLM